MLSQVERWFNEIYPDGSGRVWGTVYPRGTGDGDGDDALEAKGRAGGAPDILISTPSALWDRLEHPEDAHWLRKDTLRQGLQVVAMDEPDAIIRPLPGRYEQQRNVGRTSGQRQHVFHRHPPVGVKLLETILPGRQEAARGRKVQTIWTSATVNSLLRGYIVKRGWARPRGEGGVVLEHSGGEHGETNGVQHVCWVVDPDSGKHTDLSEPVPPMQEDKEQKTDPVGPGQGEVHPHLIEALALHWASRGNSAKSLVVPPNGASVRKLQETLSDLGCPSVSLDVDSRETARDVGEALRRDQVGEVDARVDPGEDGTTTQDTLYILPRSHLRGIDLPNVKTVYLLGGLGVKDLKGGGTGAGVWAEREREYLHWAGRMGRMSGTAVEADDKGADDGENIIMTFVLKGPEEVLMRRFMEKMKERQGGQIGEVDDVA